MAIAVETRLIPGQELREEINWVVLEGKLTLLAIGLLVSTRYDAVPCLQFT